MPSWNDNTANLPDREAALRTELSAGASAGASLPTGGTTGQTLTKNSGTDGDVTWHSPSFINLALYCKIDGTTDDSSALQSLVTSLPSTGGTIFHPGGVCKLSSAVDLQAKRIRFLGPSSGLNTDTSQGAWFSTGTASQSLFTCQPTTLQQVGPSFSCVGLVALHSGVTLLNTKNVNRVILRDCTFLGYSGLDTIGVVFNNGGGSLDSSWHRIDECNFQSCATGVQAKKSFGGVMCGGEFNACTIGFDLQSVSSGWRLYGIKGDGGNPCFNMVGSMSQCIGCVWEVTGGATPKEGFKLDGSGVSPSGAGLSVIGCTMTGGGVSGQVGIELTANLNAPVLAGLSFSNLGTSIKNASLAPRLNFVGSYGASGPQILWGTGSPEAVYTANAGSIFQRTDGGAGTTLYVKESGSGNTGWVAK